MKRNERLRIHRKETRSLTMMAIPGILLLLVFNYLPMSGAVMAFKDFNPRLGIWGSPWNGFENFKFFFESQDAIRTIRNTLFYSCTFLVLDIITTVGLALMFFHLRSQRALKVYNTVVILPRFLSAVLIAFIVYTLLSHSHGLINTVIELFGGEGIKWYLEAKYWPVILTITHIWGNVGMGSVLYYASLMSLDTALLEAATLDGANTWQKIWHVMIPHLIPIIIIRTIMAMGSIFNGDFGLFFQVPKNSGMLYETTDIINTYTYRALQEGNLAKGAAVGLFQSAAGAIMLLIVNGIVRKVRPEDAFF